MSITRVAGRGVCVRGNDLDTDRIIPARFLKCVTFDDLGPSLFYDERFDESGASKNHVLDAPRHQGAEILISDDNFGCGSSREHAPQAIRKFGIRALIAGSFAEIFQGNCTTLGMPCLVMAASHRGRLAAGVERHPEAEIVIDLESMQVTCANATHPVTMKASTREAFLAGSWDPLDNLLGAAAQIRRTASRLGYI